jgi:hypothetical protein
MAKSSSFTGELVHFGVTRMRVTGAGNLQLFLHSLDDTLNSNTLPIIPLQATTNREPTVLANFIDQYGQLEVKTTEIDEVFEISKIVIFVKPISSGYPQ